MIVMKGASYLTDEYVYNIGNYKRICYIHRIQKSYEYYS